MTDREFLKAFEGYSLGQAEWTHAAHVRAAWLCLATSPTYKEALYRLRAGVRGTNYFLGPCGCRQQGRRGYHETITTAYTRVIASRTRDGETFEGFRERNPDLFAEGKEKLAPLLAFYSPARLFSDAARDRFLRPDLAPLPARTREGAKKLTARLSRRLVPV